MIKQLLNSVITKYHDLSVSRRSIICLSLRLRWIIDLLATDKSRYFAQPRPIIVNYYPFKIFPLFLLVKATRIIHHNQLLLTKYWTNDVKSAARQKLMSRWRQKCSLLQIIKLLTEKTWGQGCVIFGEQENKERNGETRLRTRKYFEWIIQQLLNSAFVGYDWKILQISEGVIHLGLRPL